MIFIVRKNIVFLVWAIYEFRQTKHFLDRFLSQKNLRIVVVLTIISKSSKSTREFEKHVSSKFFSQWVNDSIFFQNVCLQLQFDIEYYRQTFIYKSFEQFKQSLRNSFLFSDTTSKRSFVSILLVSISLDSNTSFKANFFFRSNVSKTTRFLRRNNDSKLRVSIVSSSIDQKVFDNINSIAQISLIYSKVSRNIINSTKQIFFEFNSLNTREIFVEKNIYDVSIESNFSSMNANLNSIVQTIIIVVVTTTIAQITTQFQSQQNQNDENQNENQNFQSTIRFSKDINYFDLKYVDVNDSFNTSSIVIIDRYIWYRDVYVFIDKLKNLVKKFIDESRIKELLSNCLKKETLIWKNNEYNDVFKNALRVVNLKIWYSFLINQFKKRVSIALQIMQTKKYTMTNARNDKFSRDYVQNILRHVEVVDFFFFFNQMTLVWNNLNIEFRAQISKSKITIELSIFLNQLNEKTSIWRDIVTNRRENVIIDNFDNVDNIDKNRQINKQNRERQDDFQHFDVNDSQFFFSQWWSSQNYISYQFKNFVYQNQKNQYQFFDEKAFVQFVLQFSKQSLRITSKNASNSRNQTNQKKNVEKSFNRSKSRAHVVDENDSNEKLVKDFQKDDDFVDYYNQHDLNYFDSQY